MKTIAIAGATGVLGHALAPKLLARGWRVRALTRGRRPVPPGCDPVEGDLLDAAAVARLVDGCDAAIHGATEIPADASNAEAWARNTKLRIDGTRILLAACEAAKVRRYLQQSIVMIYADGGEASLDESTPLDRSRRATGPVAAMEEQVRASSLAWTIFRGGMFTGPGTFEDARREALRAGALPIPGEGRAWMPYVHVADVADALVAMLDRDAAGATLHLVDDPIRNGEYLEGLAREVGGPPPRRDAALPEPESWRCSNAAARTSLGWAPRGILGRR